MRNTLTKIGGVSGDHNNVPSEAASTPCQDQTTPSANHDA